DYISITDNPSIHDHRIVHVRPALDAGIVQALGEAVPEAIRGGIYVQTRGPRIETVAEVRALAGIADIVGMTVASEATLACELGMRFGALAMVDNYANGLGDEVLTYECIVATAKEYCRRTEDILERIVERLL
ncbi:MAG: 5'-methylthioadenosine phosphorylase, partial [Methanomicrobiaceae archaeon]|nr:5'-methylthioadenosine phosphorylase [Methanomicrobiaceae archaeon]